MMNATINPFTNSEIAAGYENWYKTSGYQADIKEKSLLKWLLKKFPLAGSMLEIGCGTGHFTRWFEDQGMQTTGLDQSRNMIREAQTIGHQVYIQGDAQNLPFPSNSFDVVAMITALEFLPAPAHCLAEALRISRQGIILGVINKQSSLGRKYKQAGGPIWDAAVFYTPKDLKRIIHKTDGKARKIHWRTTLFPFLSGSLPLPWGGFIGMSIVNNPVEN